jgi:hypothetical protein
MTARERGARLFFIVLCLLATAIGFAVGEAVLIHRLRVNLAQHLRQHRGPEAPIGYYYHCDTQGECHLEPVIPDTVQEGITR